MAVAGLDMRVGSQAVQGFVSLALEPKLHRILHLSGATERS